MLDLLRRILVAVLVSFGACREHAPARAPLAVEIAGCAEVRPGPVCELPADPAKRTLRIHVASEGATGVEVLIDDRAVAPGSREGGLLRVAIPAKASSLEVRAKNGPEGRAAFRAVLATQENTSALDAADELRKRGRFEEALAALEPLRDAKDTAVRARVTGITARVRLATGATDEAIKSFEEALVLDRAGGRLSGEFLDRFALAYTLLHRARFADARRVLEPLRGLVTLGDGHAMLPYYEALLAHETGDVRAALASYREAVAGADRLDLGAQKLDARVMVLELNHMIGRDEEAPALLADLRRAIPSDLTPCKRAEVLHNLGWFALVARQSTEIVRVSAEDPVPPLEEARALLETTCKNPSQLGSALTTLALAKLTAGDPEVARRAIAEARSAVREPGPRLGLYWAHVDAQIALERGDAEGALALAERLSQLGASAFSPTYEWRGAVARGRALEKLGRIDEAQRAYEAAEAMLDERRRSIPLGEGRSSFLGSHNQSARLLVDLLARRGELDAAARAARRSRARSLSSVEWVGRVAALGANDRARWDAALSAYRREREALDAESASDWKLSSDELARVSDTRKVRRARIGEALDRAREILGRAGDDAGELSLPRAGELFLVYHPIREGWLGIAVSAAGTTARALAAIDPRASREHLADVLLVPFEKELGRARKLRVIAYGAMDDIDFHALPWKGAPLAEAVPVAYGADVRRTAPPRLPGTRALVVADPRGDLPLARKEARMVAVMLGRRGLEVTILEGEAATTRAVRGALEREGMALFHYAGHGLFGGRDATGSGLPLAGGNILDTADVLSLARSPRHVVLSGCETARAGGDADRFGISQSFLIAGADAVIGATRPVDDRLAQDVMLALYESMDDGGFDDAPLTLARIELALSRARPKDDWASFRVLVP